jgi:protease I
MEDAMAEKPEDSYVATMRPSGKDAILIITANDTQDLEFFYPYYRFIEAGFRVDVATPKGGAFKGKMGMGLKETRPLENINPEQYVLLYIPGGKAPAELMKNQNALEITRQFVRGGKPVSAICHGPQVLAAADVISGKRIAAWPEVEAEVEAAGATYVNDPTVVDGQFITARWPGDLPSHLKATLAMLPAKNRSNLAA